MAMANELLSVDLSAVWRYLVRRIWIAVVLSLLAAGGTWVYLTVYPFFQSRAILMVQTGETTQLLGGFEPGDLLELALSPQVIEKTSKEFFSQTALKRPPTLQAQLTLQKRLLLMSKGADPAAATTALDLWIKKLKSEYEKTFRLNVDQQEKHQENFLNDLTKRYRDLEQEYRGFLAREQPAVLQETLEATVAQYRSTLEGPSRNALKARLQELTTKSLAVSSQDQQYQTDLAEVKKNINQATSRMQQLTMLSNSVPEVIKTVLLPSEPSIPYYDPIKVAVIMGILSFGFLGILILLIGAGKNVK
jgi:hypothetical protein